MAEQYGVSLPTGSCVPTPLLHMAKLDVAANDEERCDLSLFRSICGVLQFASHYCRPDVSQSTKELCKLASDRPHTQALQGSAAVLQVGLPASDQGLQSDIY